MGEPAGSAVSTSGEAGDDACPYQGLAPFEADNTELFFGRARATRDLIERLGRRLDGRGSILMVSGASGVGKSSLLRAGLLPGLAKGMLPLDGSAGWPRLLLTPTAKPLWTLAECLAEVYGEPVDAVHESLRDGPSPGGSRLVLVVDQFEELFTLVADERERQAFVRALHALTEGPHGAGVIVGVRADYWDRCAAYPAFAEAIQDGQVIVEPMTESDMRLAITGPAAAVGLEIEPGLVETVLAELRDDGDATGRYAAGALPLLSQALRNTWDRRENGRLTVRGYEESGRVRDAVQHTADQVFEGLSAEDRMTALRAFRRMTVITAGGRVARRPAALTEIHAAASAQSADERERVAALVSAFADQRLLTLTEDTAEISHDALLTAWPTLRDWLAPDLTAQAVYDQLIEDAERWDEHRRDSAFLYRGGRLLAVHDTRPRWERDRDSFPPPGPMVEGFVAASTRAASRAERRRRLVISGLAMLSLLALIAAGTAIRAANDADHQRALAVSRGLAAQSEIIGDTDPRASSLLAVSAWRIAPTPEARYSMLNAAAHPGRGVLPGHTGPIASVAFSPDGKTIATGGTDRTVRLWDTASRRQLGAPIAFSTDECHSADINVAFHPGGKILATGCLGNIVRFWDVTTQRPVGGPLDNQDWVMALAFGPDGTLATANLEGTIRLWDTNSRRQRGDTIVYRQSSEYKQVKVVAISPDGKLLAAAGTDDTVRVWDTATHRQVGPTFTEHVRGVGNISFSPDGKTLATTGIDGGRVRLWNLSDHRQVGELRMRGVSDTGYGIAFSPDGKRLAVAQIGSAVQLWDPLNSQKVGGLLADSGSATQGVAFSPDGRLLAATGFDGVLRLLDVGVHQQIGAAMPGRSVVALSPDGKTLAAPVAGGSDPTLSLWDAATQRPIDPPIRHADPASPGKRDSIYRVAFSGDGATIATAVLGDGGVRQWDSTTHRQVGAPVYSAPDELTAETIEFSPDGSIFALKGSNSIRFWDVAGRRQLGSTINIPNLSDVTLGTAVSPDNRIVAVGSRDLSVRLFDTATRRQLGSPLRVGSSVHALAFSPDSKTLATGGGDKAVRLWDVASRRQLGTPLVGHTGIIRSMAFSPDGKALVTGSQDDTARLWDLTTYQQIGLPLTGHTDMVVGVAYSRDGSTVATVSEDKTVRLWNVAISADLAAVTCANAGRSFTRAEWRRYIPGEEFRQVCQ